MAEEEEYIWKEEIPVPVHLITYVDEGVKEALPAGTQFHGISPSGASYWARTAKIDATDEDGNESPFFIKVHRFDHGKNMASSEYEAMKILYGVYPEIVPEPMAWGSYKEENEVYFFVTRFYELSGDIPDVSDFPELLAEMHKRPEAKSKTGEFGFPITTYGGRNPVKFPLSKTWEGCITKCFEEAFAAEEHTQGPDTELARLREALFTKVIPRLIRPMETEGRHLEPILCHGDLWDGNASIDAATGEPKIFDPTPLWAHNEYEMAPWFIPRHRMTDAYINEYIKHYPVAKPAQDFEDRGLLYSLRFNIHASSIYPGNLRMRNTAMNNMRYLVEKYPGGYEEYARERGVDVERTKSDVDARIAANMATSTSISMAE